MKVAIIHYWLDSFRGGEKVIEAICEIYPNADIYTHIYDPLKIPQTIKSHKIQTTFIQKLPFAYKYSRYYIALMPIALLFLNLKKYDLIISSESGPAKGIRKRKDAMHICYCHTPMRYIWDMQNEYISGSSLPIRCLWKLIACYMRKWDKWSAKKVDYFIANSKFVAARIRKYYKRKSVVIHPPVNISFFEPNKKREDFYLFLSQLVPYKKADIIITAFNSLKLPLHVVGSGTEYNRLKKLAKENITLHGRVDDEELKNMFETCKAFVYAGKEDFGIVFAEALSAGAPVIAYGKGGVKDIVKNGKNGIFFTKQTSDSLISVIEKFEKGKFNLDNSSDISKSARQFSTEIFIKKIKEYIEEIF